jgi:NhaP-type Na+/H+ or K+/H+ antiporter
MILTEQSSTATVTGWIQVETVIEVAVYGFIGGVVGMLGKWLVQHIRAKLQSNYKR